MAQSYVNFVRGTPSAYSSIAKDDNTLYFIYNAGATDGMLYLGDKLIVGGLSSSASINDLGDINIDDKLANNYILVYDSSSKKWIDKNITDVFQTLMPSLIESCQAQILYTTNQSGETDEQAIARITADSVLHSGDFVILNLNTAQQKDYLYDGEDWCLLSSSSSINVSNFDSALFGLNSDNKIIIKGFDSADNGTVLVKSSDGEASWQAPSDIFSGGGEGAIWQDI